MKEGETEEALRNDPDLQLVPIIVEKILLPKVTRKSIYCIAMTFGRNSGIQLN